MKQVILMRTDLGMSKGKMIAQGSHAAVSGALRMNRDSIWTSEGMTKIILKVESEDQLLALIQLALKKKLNTGLIHDAGKTKFNGTVTTTCGWIGPDEDYKIDLITDKLKLL